MMRKDWIFAVSLVLLALVLTGLYFFRSPDRVGFVYNQTLFKSFKGTVELEAKLSLQRKANKKVLDSLTSLINGGRRDLVETYDKNAQSFLLWERDQTEKYNADIWKFINEGIREFGKENNYDLIFGATGDGNLMYAREGKDLTNEIVDFINKKYAK
jgi:outer membrane protein